MQDDHSAARSGCNGCAGAAHRQPAVAEGSGLAARFIADQKESGLGVVPDLCLDCVGDRSCKRYDVRIKSNIGYEDVRGHGETERSNKRCTVTIQSVTVTVNLIKDWDRWDS